VPTPPLLVSRPLRHRRRRRRYETLWGPHRERIRAVVAAAAGAECFLHLAKTGGSSATTAIEQDPGHVLILMPRSYRTPGPLAASRINLATVDPDRCVGRRVVFKFGHEEFAATEWLRRQVDDPRAVRTLFFVRPARRRLVSAFTDYWARVAEAESVERGAPAEPHRRPVLAGYLEDAKHYRATDGTIDGIAWFTSFGRYGPGMPFFLGETFDSPRALRAALDRDDVTVGSTDTVDAILHERGLEAVRRRVSHNRDDPAIRAALDAASGLIDDLARRDAPYDRIIADHLGDPAFLP